MRITIAISKKEHRAIISRVIMITIVIVCVLVINKAHAVSDEGIESINNTAIWNKDSLDTALFLLHPKIDRSHILIKDGLIWEKEKKDGRFGRNRAKNWNDATTYCANHTNNGMRNFRLPTVEELEIARTDWPFSTASKWFSKYYWSNSKKGNIVYALETYKRKGIQEIQISTKADFRCISDEFNQFQSVSELTDVLKKAIYDRETTVSYDPKPIKTSYRSIQELKKGEFETTTEFEKRKEKVRREVVEFNKAIDESYQENLMQWKKKRENTELESRQKGESLDKRKVYSEALGIAMGVFYGRPLIRSVKYNADNQVFSVTLISERGGYTSNVEIPVGIEYARKFKGILSASTFKPTVEIELSSGKNITVSGISEIKDPKQLVVDNEYRNSLGSVTKLRQFIKKYPNTKEAINARTEILSIEEHERKIKIAAKKAKEVREKRRAAEEKAERDAYLSVKSVGNKVCKPGRVALGLIGITITGFVERVNGNSIQIRISSTEGQSVSYNDVPLREGTVIWDNYSKWKKCE